MKRMLLKITALALALITIVTGGMFVNLNQEAEAAKTYKATFKVCSHTNIYVSLDKSGGYEYQIKCKKGTYTHNHAHSWIIKGSTENNQDQIYTKTLTTELYGATTGSVKNNKKFEVRYSESKTTLGIIRKNKNQAFKTAYNCPECKLSKSASTGVVTVKTPCCKKTIKINTKTGKKV